MTAFNPIHEARFPEGVSGYSLAERDLAIWTRLAGVEAPEVVVQWELFGADPLEPVRSGLALARAGSRYVVRIVLTGLPPGCYEFRFCAGGESSPLGQVNLPAADALSAPAVPVCPVSRPSRWHPAAGLSAHG